MFSYSFNGKSREDGAEKWLYNNNHTIEVSGTAKQTAVKNLTISTNLYIPKSVLSKKGSKITVSPCLQLLNTKGKAMGDLYVRMHVTAENVNGKMYIDNVQVLSGTKKIVNLTFSSKPKIYRGYYKGKAMSSKKISIVTF